jgi:hypothetical protein
LGLVVVVASRMMSFSAPCVGHNQETKSKRTLAAHPAKQLTSSLDGC